MRMHPPHFHHAWRIGKALMPHPLMPPSQLVCRVQFSLLGFMYQTICYSQPPSAISLPGTRLAPIMGTLSFSLWMQLGSHPIQAPHREFEKGKQSKTGEIQQPIWWSFHPSWELSPISHDNEDAAGRASLSWGVGLSLYSPKGHVLEGRSVDLETGVWCSCCDELNLPDCSALT